MCNYDPSWTLRRVVEQIAAIFREDPRWLGYYAIRARGLGTCDPALYEAAMRHLGNRGLIMALNPHDAQFSVYILTSLTYRAGRRRRSKGGAR